MRLHGECHRFVYLNNLLTLVILRYTAPKVTRFTAFLAIVSN